MAWAFIILYVVAGILWAIVSLRLSEMIYGRGHIGRPRLFFALSMLAWPTTMVGAIVCIEIALAEMNEMEDGEP